MFKKVFFENLSSNFTNVTIGGNNLNIEWGFGEVAEDAKSPYISLFEFDDDGSRQYLCDDLFASGSYVSQCNIYADSNFTSSTIKYELDRYLDSLNGKELTDGVNSYTIVLVSHDASPTSQSLTNGLAVDVLANTIIYKLNGD